MQYKGTYNPDLLYSPNDVVLFGNSSFVACRMTKGEQPSIFSHNWGLVAAGGANGANGADGRNGSEGQVGPGISPGGSPGQFLAKSSSHDYATAWVDINPQSIGAAAESHTHDAMSIIGMQEALNTRSAAIHSHQQSDIVGLSQALLAKADAKHSHFAEEIIGGNLTADTIDADSVIAGSAIITSDGISFQTRSTIHVDGCDAISMIRDQTVIGNTLVAEAIRVRKMTAPLSSTAPGTAGDIGWDESHLYVCVSSNSWKRIPLQNW